jgi:hypothetical protein
MRNALANWVQQVSVKLLDSGGNVASRTSLTLADSVEQAREEWLNSRAYFETVYDPDLVDHAIYLMEAAERKYVYLLKKARESGVTVNFQ